MLDNVDLDLLLRARLWVARLGESDVHGWWRTNGILGEDGAFVVPRVLPKTHPTARARIAFAVARHGCDERHPDPKVLHLFRLTPEVEDRLDALLVERLGDEAFWGGLMPKLESIKAGADTGAVLAESAVVTDGDLQRAREAAVGPDARSLRLEAQSADEAVRRLAAGFIRSQPKALAVPYIELGA
jgi:hypothetical protein